MRMWMVNPIIMCKNHLLGEHKELHMLIGHLHKQRRVDNYIKNNCLELRSIKARHDALVEELKFRKFPSGFNHKTPVDILPDISYLPEWQRFVRVDRNLALEDLISRCPSCNHRYKRLMELNSNV